MTTPLDRFWLADKFCGGELFGGVWQRASCLIFGSVNFNSYTATGAEVRAEDQDEFEQGFPSDTSSSDSDTTVTATADDMTKTTSDSSATFGGGVGESNVISLPNSGIKFELAGALEGSAARENTSSIAVVSGAGALGDQLAEIYSSGSGTAKVTVKFEWNNTWSNKNSSCDTRADIDLEVTGINDELSQEVIRRL